MIGRRIGMALAMTLAAVSATMAEEARRPQAIVLTHGGSQLLAANRGTGTVSVVDVKSRRVTGEAQVGRGLADIRTTGDETVLLAVDQSAGEVVLLHDDRNQIQRRAAVAVAADPVSATVFGDGRRAVVLSRWSRAATFVAWDGSAGLRVVGSMSLPFSPREAAVLPGSQRAVVVDAFGGKIALLDLGACLEGASPVSSPLEGEDRPQSGQMRGTTAVDRESNALTSTPGRSSPSSGPSGHLPPPGGKAVANPGTLIKQNLNANICLRVWSLPEHNLRRPVVTADGRSVAIVGQHAGNVHDARTSRQDVEWGLVISPALRLLRIEGLRPETTDAELLKNSRRAGLVGGTADPSAIAFGPKGEVIAAMAGTGEVASSLALGEPYERIRVGRGPSALAIDAEAKTAYTADEFDDAITVVDLVAGRFAARIPLSADGPRKPASLVEEGAALFRDARLSEDGWMSCQTCHTDGHTAGVMVDTKGDDTYGAPKRTPSLLGVAETSPFGWLGKVRRLDEQIHKSLETTMHAHDPSPRQVEALAAYLKTLAPPPPISTEAQAVARGREIFDSSRCDACHTAPSYTTPMRYDVGLADAVGNHEFNPPSLRGVAHRPALLHDGSVSSLSDLFRRTRHPDQTEMTDAEIDDLVAFLNSL
ncbi:cytochrome c peroxidase [Paludisphaera rhizosphaerae]|uniref:cytochrome c peroxidase n=1 Tax=Paludisphaera rhizosphaerae TaxID=2711216 RepID=UPI0013EADAD8|nr:cytochrome c peroxidase [Paludisphaera rhizosphaerae]